MWRSKWMSSSTIGKRRKEAQERSVENSNFRGQIDGVCVLKRLPFFIQST